MNRCLPVVAAAALVVVLAGCRWRDKPEDFEHHSHVVTITARTVNQDSCDLDLERFTIPIVGYRYWRHADTDDRDFLFSHRFIGGPTIMQLYSPDTTAHRCSFRVEHYVGYQEARNAPDTNRLAGLDSNSPWYFSPEVECVQLQTSDSGFWDILDFPGINLPDTLRGNDTIAIELTLDLAGALDTTRVHGEWVLHYHPEFVYARQRW